MKPIKIIDLFAGPGGLGEGFSALKVQGEHPFKVVVSVEKESSAHATLTLRAFVREFADRQPPREYYQYVRGEITKQQLFDAHPKQYDAAQRETLYGPQELGKDNKIIHKAIEEAIGASDKWMLIGGPPCQAYSLVGRARNQGTKGYKAEKDHRHFLYKEYLDILHKFQPPVFVMENVKGILSSKVSGNPIFDQILDDLRHEGYEIYSLSKNPRGYNDQGPVYLPQDFVIRAEEHGIPQTRHRVILLGIRRDKARKNMDFTLDKTDAVSLKQVIDKLPKLRSGISKDEDTADQWRERIQESAKSIASVLDDRALAKSIREWANLITLPRAGRGGRYVQAEIDLDSLPNSLRTFLQDKKIGGALNHEARSHITKDLERYFFASCYANHNNTSPKLGDFPRRLKPQHANRDSGKFVDRFKVQQARIPASTITSHISKDGHYFIHYDPKQCRSLTVREAARAQTFPDNYFFEGNRTQQYVQVGNAVPPFLAKLIAVRIEHIL